MDKNKKIELLNIIRDEIDNLYNKKWCAEFSAWKSKSEILISKIFKDETYLKNFKNINYSLFCFTTDTTDYEFEMAYNDGLDKAKALLNTYIETVELLDSIEDNCGHNIACNSNKVFIVHGRDNETKLEVARFLEKLKLEPIILHEQASGGKTVIEKIEDYTNVRFAIVLYTPCDIGGLSGSNNNELKQRARQNVIFEHGYLIGKIGRKNVSALVKGDIELPNDISGIVYINMGDGNWKIDIAKELRSAGYDIDFNLIF